jgi:large subunit ribosomal protein L21
MIGVIATGGKQYIVAVGQKIKIEKIGAKAGDIVDFKNILDAASDIKGKVLVQGMGKKVSMIKFKNKSRYIKRIGHRQPFTTVEITAVGKETTKPVAVKPAVKTAEAVTAAKPAVKKLIKKKSLSKPTKAKSDV